MENPNTPDFWDDDFVLEHEAYQLGDDSRWRFTPLRFWQVANLMPLRGSVLDYGCGLGHFCRFLHAAFPDRYTLYGVDISPAAVQIAKHYDKQSYYGTSVDDLPLDAVVCMDVIEHVSDPGALLEELKAHLKPGGTLILTTPHRRPMGEKWSPEHQTEFSQNGLIDLCLRHGFVDCTVAQPLLQADFTIYFSCKKPL